MSTFLLLCEIESQLLLLHISIQFELWTSVSVYFAFPLWLYDCLKLRQPSISSVKILWPVVAYAFVNLQVSLTQARIDMSELDEDSDGFLQSIVWNFSNFFFVIDDYNFF